MNLNVLLLINERVVRERVSEAIGSGTVMVDQYATAAQALEPIVRHPFDLIVMDAKVYPGLGCSDILIREIATLLPDAKHTENLLYWQVGLRVLERLRDPKSVNIETPVLIRFPELAPDSFTAEDILTRDAVESDLKDKGTIRTVIGAPLDTFVAAALEETESAAAHRMEE